MDFPWPCPLPRIESESESENDFGENIYNLSTRSVEVNLAASAWRAKFEIISLHNDISLFYAVE